MVNVVRGDVYSYSVLSNQESFDSVEEESSRFHLKRVSWADVLVEVRTFESPKEPVIGCGIQSPFQLLKKLREMVADFAKAFVKDVAF